MKIRNVFNYRAELEQYEVNTLPSMTVPDGTMSIREIFDRYARGAALPMKDVYWDEDPELELPDLDHMDLVDRAAYREQISIELDNLKNQNYDKKAEDVSREQPLEDEVKSEDK